MTKSVIVQADEVTKNLLKLVEDEIYESTRSAINDVKEDILEEINKNKKGTYLISDEVKKLKGLVEDLLNETTSLISRKITELIELQKINCNSTNQEIMKLTEEIRRVQELQGVIPKEVDKIISDNIKSIDLKVEENNIKIQQLEDSMKKYINKNIKDSIEVYEAKNKDILATLNILDEKIFSLGDDVNKFKYDYGIKIDEGISSILSRIDEKTKAESKYMEDLIKDVNVIKQDINWLKLPFYKRLFKKRM